MLSGEKQKYVFHEKFKTYITEGNVFFFFDNQMSKSKATAQL